MDNLFYDIEVFKYNSMVVFKDDAGETVKIFSNDTQGLEDYPAGVVEQGYSGLRDFIDGKTLIGYNNYWYDDYILYAMSMNLSQSTIKEWNDSIIEGKSKVNMRKINNRTLDCFQQIDVSRPGLKKIEGNKGLMIKESAIDFNIDRPLTAEEIKETAEYCEYDVLQVCYLYKERQTYFNTKNRVLSMLNDPRIEQMAYKWNTTTIVGQLMQPSTRVPKRRMVEDSMLKLVPYEVEEMWRELDRTIDFKFKKKKVTIDECGNLIEFGWGGLHGAPVEPGRWRNVKLLDVASMYPSIIVLMNGLGDKTKLYKSLKEERVHIKHSDPEKADAYKLILNSLYGILNNKYSKLNNPHMAYSVCIFGQIALYTLTKRLHNIGCKIININTDGVGFLCDDDRFNSIWHEWEEEFGLDLELEEYDLWVQKDVNNYVAIEKGSGKIVTKGGDVNKYKGDNFFKNNDIRITHLALVDYLLYGKPVEQTLYDNLHEPRLFQYILQAGHTFKGTCDNDEKDYQKINRVFAVKENVDNVTLYKYKVDDDGTKRLSKFPDAPERMKVWNDDVSEYTDFKKEVDIQFYYDLIMKIIGRWK